MSRFESRADRIARLEADPRFRQRADGAWLFKGGTAQPPPAEEPEPDDPADLGALFDQPPEAPEDLAAFLAS